MAIDFCPGSSKFRQPEPEEIKCPSCAEVIEIWTDEIKVACPKCKNVVMRKIEGASCLDWCKYAKECVGDEKLKQYGRMKGLLRKQALLLNTFACLEQYVLFGVSLGQEQKSKNCVLNSLRVKKCTFSPGE